MVKKAVATQESVFSVAVPDHVEDGNRGSDAVGADDLTIPRLQLIQDLSPQRKKNQPEYIEGATEGQLFNSLTSQLYGEDVIFIPCYFRKEYVVWVDRDKGGGFRGTAPDLATAEIMRQGLEDGDICESIETAQQFGMIYNPAGGMEPIVISMSKSQLTPSRKLNSMVSMAKGDRWARAYKCKAVLKSGAKGDYYNYEFQPLGYCPEELLEDCVKFYESIASGEADVSRSTDTVESDEM